MNGKKLMFIVRDTEKQQGCGNGGEGSCWSTMGAVGCGTTSSTVSAAR